MFPSSSVCTSQRVTINLAFPFSSHIFSSPSIPFTLVLRESNLVSPFSMIKSSSPQLQASNTKNENSPPPLDILSLALPS